MTLYYPIQDGFALGGTGPWDESLDYMKAFGLLGTGCGISFEPDLSGTYSAVTLKLSYDALVFFEAATSGAVEVWFEDSLAPEPFGPEGSGSHTATLLTSLVVPTVPSPLVFDVTEAVVARSQAVGWSGRLNFIIKVQNTMISATFWASEHVTEALRPVLETTAPEPEPGGGGSRRLVLPIWPEPDTSILP